MKKFESFTVEWRILSPAEYARYSMAALRRSLRHLTPWMAIPEAVEIAARLYDQFGFDFVDNSPLSESWRTTPGQPAWIESDHRTSSQLMANLAKAQPVIRP